MRLDRGCSPPRGCDRQIRSGWCVLSIILFIAEGRKTRPGPVVPMSARSIVGIAPIAAANTTAHLGGCRSVGVVRPGTNGDGFRRRGDESRTGQVDVESSSQALRKIGTREMAIEHPFKENSSASVMSATRVPSADRTVEHSAKHPPKAVESRLIRRCVVERSTAQDLRLLDTQSLRIPLHRRMPYNGGGPHPSKG